jgi:hypothetical protein
MSAFVVTFSFLRYDIFRSSIIIDDETRTHCSSGIELLRIKSTKGGTMTNRPGMLVAVLILTCWSSDGFLPRSPTPRVRKILERLDASDADDESMNTQISDFCKGTNEFWKGLVVEPVRNFVEIQPAGTAGSDPFSKLTAPPELPGIPRPVWLTILGSVPTALGWYGYYKFSVEEELYQYELQETGSVSGCGGYGTLFPFVFGILVGFPLSVLHIPGGENILQAAAFWILAGQVNLYRRVNEICLEEKGALKLQEPPLHTWWALLPPPLDVVVGLRQVHYLSEYWRIKRDEPYDKDVIAEELFPFISAQRFTLKEFFRTPSMWFWFTKDWKDLDIDFLKD